MKHLKYLIVPIALISLLGTSVVVWNNRPKESSAQHDRSYMAVPTKNPTDLKIEEFDLPAQGEPVLIFKDQALPVNGYLLTRSIPPEFSLKTGDQSLELVKNGETLLVEIIEVSEPLIVKHASGDTEVTKTTVRRARLVWGSMEDLMGYNQDSV